MPTWYGNVCRSGAVSYREQPSDPEQSRREMDRRREESDRDGASATATDSPLHGSLPGRILRGRAI